MDEENVVVSSVYAVYDLLSKTYGPLQEFVNDDSCIRAMKKSFQSKDFDLDWCRDFQVFKLGNRLTNFSGKQYFSFFQSEVLLVTGTSIYEEILKEKKESEKESN